MDKQLATNQFISSCLDVNSSWREAFNEIGLLWTMDLDIDQGWTSVGDGIRDNLIEQGLAEEVEDREVDELIYGYLIAECEPMSKELILALEDWAREIVEDCGADEDYFDEWMADN